MGHRRCPLPWLASCSIHRACWGVRVQVAAVDAAVIAAGEDDDFMGVVDRWWEMAKAGDIKISLKGWKRLTRARQVQHLANRFHPPPPDASLRDSYASELADAINQLLGIGEWGPVLVVLCALDGPSVSCLTLHPLPAAPRPSRLLSAEPGECWMGVGTGTPVRCVQPPLWKAVVRGGGSRGVQCGTSLPAHSPLLTEYTPLPVSCCCGAWGLCDVLL
jgi:hypothetical protein